MVTSTLTDAVKKCYQAVKSTSHWPQLDLTEQPQQWHFLSYLVPIQLKLQYESVNGTVFRLRKIVHLHNTKLQHTYYAKKINVWNNHGAETIERRIYQNPKDIIIYTDGSKLESGATSLVFVAYKKRTKNIDLVSAFKEV